MTHKEKQEFKKLIDKQIIELSDEITSIEEAMYPKRGEGPTDKVAHLNFKLDQSLHIQRLEVATKRLNLLKNAYLRIDSPDFGICQECEEEIPLERLKLKPESIYCIDCMQELGM